MLTASIRFTATAIAPKSSPSVGTLANSFIIVACTLKCKPICCEIFKRVKVLSAFSSHAALKRTISGVLWLAFIMPSEAHLRVTKLFTFARVDLAK